MRNYDRQMHRRNSQIKTLEDIKERQASSVQLYYFSRDTSGKSDQVRENLTKFDVLHVQNALSFGAKNKGTESL